MKRYFRYIIILCLASCGKSGNSNLDREEVPVYRTAEIGHAYDTAKEQFNIGACVEGEEKKGGLGGESELLVSQDIDFDSMVKLLNGQLSAGANFPGISVKGAVDYASRNASTNYSSTYTLFYEVKPESVWLIPKTLKVNSFGQKAINMGEKVMLETCGDEYLSEIAYGSRLLVNLKFVFANSLDKRSIEGELSAAISEAGVDIAKVEGSLKKVDDKVKDKIVVLLEAEQYGGDEARLVEILPDNFLECRLDNAEACFKMFNRTIAYARTMTEQLSDSSSYKPIRFITESYKDALLTELMPSELTPIINDRIDRKRRELYRMYKEYLQDNDRSSKILRYYKKFLNVDEIKAIDEIKRHTEDNATEVFKALESCYEMPRTCVEDSNQTLNIENHNGEMVSVLKDYNKDLLEIDYISCEDGKYLYGESWEAELLDGSARPSGSARYSCSINGEPILESLSCKKSHYLSEDEKSCLPKLCVNAELDLELLIGESKTLEVANGKAVYTCEYPNLKNKETNCNAGYKARGTSCEKICQSESGDLFVGETVKIETINNGEKIMKCESDGSLRAEISCAAGFKNIDGQCKNRKRLCGADIVEGETRTRSDCRPGVGEVLIVEECKKGEIRLLNIKKIGQMCR